MAFIKVCMFCQTENKRVEKGTDPHGNDQFVVECKKCLLAMDVTDEYKNAISETEAKADKKE